MTLTETLKQIKDRAEALAGALRDIEFCPRSISLYPKVDMQRTAIEALTSYNQWKEQLK